MFIKKNKISLFGEVSDEIINDLLNERFEGIRLPENLSVLITVYL